MAESALIPQSPQNHAFLYKFKVCVIHLLYLNPRETACHCNLMIVLYGNWLNSYALADLLVASSKLAFLFLENIAVANLNGCFYYFWIVFAHQYNINE